MFRIRLPNECFVRAALALVAIAFAMPAEVRASCGDYVMVGHQYPATSNYRTRSDSSNLPAVPCPCQGPNCSNQPRMPISPQVPTRLNFSGEWAFMTSPVAVGTPADFELVVDCSSCCPVDCV